MSELIESRRTNRGQGGFTLIELLVVIAILAILAGVAIFAVGGLRQEAGKAACETEFDTVRTAIASAATSSAVDTWATFVDGGAAATKYWSAAGDPLVPTVPTPVKAAGMTPGATTKADCANLD